MYEVKESGRKEKRETRKRQRQIELVKRLKHLKKNDYLEGSVVGRCQLSIETDKTPQFFLCFPVYLLVLLSPETTLRVFRLQENWARKLVQYLL